MQSHIEIAFHRHMQYAHDLRSSLKNIDPKLEVASHLLLFFGTSLTQHLDERVRLVHCVNINLMQSLLVSYRGWVDDIGEDISSNLRILVKNTIWIILVESRMQGVRQASSVEYTSSQAEASKRVA